MNQLPSDIETLHTVVRQLLAENEVLKAENHALRTELATLKARCQADSHTSHKPPASDGLRKRPALPKAPSGKRGGQPGHRGKTLRLVPNPTSIRLCPPTVCACGTDLSTATGTVIERRQVFDVPVPTLDVIEYQRLRCACPTCGHQCEGTFPEFLAAPTQYGAGVLALVTMLHTEYALPLKKIQRLFTDVYGYALNSGTILHATERCHAALDSSQAIIHAQILASPVCHFDETGIRVEGRLYWQHVASTTTATSLFVHRHRGAQALQSSQSLLPEYTGWAVHDCWRSYFQFTSCRHALCGAHLLRELTALAEQGSHWAPRMHRLLLTLYHCSDKGTHRVHYPERWSALYDRVCAHAHREEPPPTRTKRKGKPTRTPGRNLLERLITHKAGVLAFAMHTEVPFTNNQAERDLRPIKIKQKIAGCFRTLLGAQHYARIHSFLSTAQKQHRSVFKELRQVFLGNSFLLAPCSAS